MSETLVHTEDCQEYGSTCAECQAHSCTERLDGAEDFHYANVSGAELCAGCYESETQYLSTVILFDPREEKPIKYLIGEHVAFDEWGDDAPSGFQRTYHRTDPWRGYYETTVPSTIEIEAGADLWGERTNVRDLAERIQEEHENGTLPVPVYVVADLTSNVFSLAMTVRISEADEVTFRNWLTGEKSRWIDGELYVKKEEE